MDRIDTKNGVEGKNIYIFFLQIYFYIKKLKILISLFSKKDWPTVKIEPEPKYDMELRVIIWST